MSFYYYKAGNLLPDVRQVGGKGLNLCRLKNLGLNVPDFLIIESETTSQWLQSCLNLAQGESDSTKKKSLLFSCLMQNKQLNSDIEAVQQMISTIAKKNSLLSVRSSAAIEDGENFSFAGQFLTELFVDRNNLKSAVINCLLSVFEDHVKAYKKVNQINNESFSFAIIVQQMVQATCSGIGFSMQPQGNLNQMCIVAGYGAGEGIVNDLVPVDTYWIDRVSNQITGKIVSKNEQLQYQNGEIKIIEVNHHLSEIPALNDESLKQLNQILLATEKALAAPSDIEFCIDAENRLYILQMRPITTIKHREIIILDNTNIVESYPGITLPLSFDFAKGAYARLFKSSARAFRISKEQTETLMPVFNHLIAHPYGRIYYRLDNWYRMLSLVHQSKQSMRDWENAVGLSNSEMNRYVQSFRGKIRAFAAAFWLILNYKRGNERFYREFNSIYSQLRSFDQFRNNPAALWQHYQEKTDQLFQHWYLTIVNDFLAFKAFAFTQKVLEQKKAAFLANDLVSSKGGVESEENILSILKLKECVLKEPELLKLFKEADQYILSSLSEKSEWKDFYELMNEHLNRFGDRNLAELKLETNSMRNNPQLLISLIKQQLSSDVTLNSYLIKKNSNIELALQKKTQLFPKWNPQNWLLNSAIALARYGLKNRENMRFCRTRAYGAVKDIFLAIGQSMVEQKVIKQKEDVFYLHINELEEFCLNSEKKKLFELVNERRQLYDNYKNIDLPDRIMFQNDLPLFDLPAQQLSDDSSLLSGIGVSPGIVTGEAMVISEPDYNLDVKDKILVSKMTDPGWVFLMSQAKGLITERGSLLSHTAIVGRELGIPAVVNVKGALRIIKSGDIITLNGSTGSIEILSKTN
jgi:phosphohistidine swiveling domain-containing protein